jgi:hypothetical protein
LPHIQVMYAITRRLKQWFLKGQKLIIHPVLGSECMYLNRLSIRLSHLLEPRQSKVKLSTASAIPRMRAWVRKGFASAAKTSK